MAADESLRRLRSARVRARRVLEENRGFGELAEASLTCVLGQLLERIWSGSVGEDLAELNTLAGVIQRLIAGGQQALELRTRMETEVPAGGTAGGLDEGTLSRLEERLQLL
jgi:hypothetical protein